MFNVKSLQTTLEKNDIVIISKKDLDQQETEKKLSHNIQSINNRLSASSHQPGQSHSNHVSSLKDNHSESKTAELVEQSASNSDDSLNLNDKKAVADKYFNENMEELKNILEISLCVQDFEELYEELAKDYSGDCFEHIRDVQGGVIADILKALEHNDPMILEKMKKVVEDAFEGADDNLVGEELLENVKEEIESNLAVLTFELLEQKILEEWDIK